MELWLVCALLTVACYGVGEGLSKEPTVRLGSARMLVLYALGNAPIYAAWFFLGSGWMRLSGTASVVSGFTAAYPVITVAAAVAILGASLVPLQVVAIAFLMIGAVLLGVYDHPGHAAVGRAWLAPMLLAIVAWGAWGILEKLSIEALGFAGNAGVYLLVSTPIYLMIARKGFERQSAWDRLGVREALPSLLLFGIAGITIFLAIGLGPLAVVVPLTTAYPMVAILVRRFWMDERMTLPQKFAVGLAMLGAVLAAL